MAYRRKQGSCVMGRSLTFKEETSTSTSSSLAVRAIMASEERSFDDDCKNSADFIEETRKIQIRRKRMNEESLQQSANQTCSQEDQLKASRDVAMATAAKAKLLLRELRTVKADLAFAKQRCSQLEEENKIHRESREKGLSAADDDDMIRLQLETLLAEKGRLAHENSVYARENRFLREIVEYHQLTMQDVVYLNEGFEDDIQEEAAPEEEYACRTITRTMSNISTCFTEDMLPKITDVRVPQAQ